MAKSAFRKFIEGYERSDEHNGESRGKKFFCRTFSGSVTPAMHRFSERGILKALSNLSKRFQYISTKAVGAALLAFGIVTVILSFLADYGSATGEAATISFIIGVAFSLLAIPLLLSDGTFFYIFQNVKLLDKILFDFLCINRVPKSDSFKSVPISVMAILGALLGVFGYFVPVWWVIFIVFIAIFALLAFSSPEFALFSTFFVLPYISHIPYGELILTAFVAFSFVSFVRKVMSGKRVFFFEQYDALILFIMLLTGISAAISGGELEASAVLITLVLMLGYFVSSNVITNRRLTDCFITAVVLSSVPASLAALYDMISALAEGGISAVAAEGIPSTFASTESFSVFLLVAIAFSIAIINQSTGFVKFLFALVMLLDIGALVLCFQPFALLALALGILLYTVLHQRKVRTDILSVILCAVPYLAMLIIMLVDPSILNIGERVALIVESLGVFVYNIVIGIGISADSFNTALGDAAADAAGVPNIFAEIGLDIGIFALAAFVLLLVIRIRHRTIYREYIKHSEISMTSPVIAVATLAIVAFGASVNVFADSTLYYLFWCVFGVGSATLRIAKKEYDDRALYFEDTIDSESSVADVKIL